MRQGGAGSRSLWIYDAGACMLLACVTAAVFWPHLSGLMTFPWDFQGPYLTHAIARMRDGSFLAPPLWLPWGGFGIPGHLSLQDGTWYLPQYLFDFFGGHYDVVGATQLQVAHVAFAACGVYLLLSQLGARHAAALIGGVAYLFMPAFFSNAQHVDIVRGAAMMPWLLLAVDSLRTRADAQRFGFCVLVVWQFLVGSYPGIIVAGFYACAILVVVRGSERDADGSWRVGNFLLLGLAAIIAAGLAALKFLPALLDTENLRRDAGGFNGADLGILTTAVLDFDVGFLDNDVTMRDLFLPMPILVLACLTSIRSRVTILGACFAALGLLCMADIEAIRAVVSELPLMKLSRFQISDFRPVLHLGMIILAATGFERVLSAPKGRKSVLLAVALGCTALGALIAYGVELGHPLVRIRWPMLTMGVTAVAVAVAAHRGRDSIWAPWALAVALLPAIIVSGVDHVHAAARVWNMPRSDQAEVVEFGSTVRELVGKNRYQSIAYRPARLVLTPIPSERGQLYSTRYNFGWFAEAFSAFGYEDLKGSQVFGALYGLASPQATAADKQVLDWLLSPSSTVVSGRAEDVTPGVLGGCRPMCNLAQGSAGNGVARMKAFRENGAVYEMDLPARVFMTENEPWYPGWRARICHDNRCDGGDIMAVGVHGYLRGWSLPAGKYQLVTYFEPQGWALATRIARASVVLLIVVLVALTIMRRRSRVASSNSSPQAHQGAA